MSLPTPEIFTSIINSYLPEPQAGLLNGIIFGIPLKTSPVFYNQLRIVGLLHIFVLSAVVDRLSIPGDPNLKSSPKVLAATGPSFRLSELTGARDAIASAQSHPAPGAPQSLHFEGATASGSFTWKMPNLSGLTAREAFQILKGRKFQVEVQGLGLVSSQSPAPGEPIAEDSTVRLSLSE